MDNALICSYLRNKADDVRRESLSSDDVFWSGKAEGLEEAAMMIDQMEAEMDRQGFAEVKEIVKSPTLSVWDNGHSLLVTEKKAIRLGDEFIDRVALVTKD